MSRDARASDNAREWACDRLRAAYAKGLIGVETLDLRLGGVLEAQTLDQLEAYLRDIVVLGSRQTTFARSSPRPSGVVPIGVEGVASSIIIGRSEACDVVLADRSVSRRHAEVVRDSRELRIEDLGSTNGSWIGDTRIARASIEIGLHVRLGNQAIVFTSGDSTRVSRGK